MEIRCKQVASLRISPGSVTQHKQTQYCIRSNTVTAEPGYEKVPVRSYLLSYLQYGVDLIDILVAGGAVLKPMNNLVQTPSYFLQYSTYLRVNPSNIQYMVIQQLCWRQRLTAEQTLTPLPV